MPKLISGAGAITKAPAGKSSKPAKPAKAGAAATLPVAKKSVTRFARPDMLGIDTGTGTGAFINGHAGAIARVNAAASTGSGVHGRKPIVSAAHLAAGLSAELSEFEFGLIVASNAFSRWAVRCISAAGLKDMTTTDVLVLHHVNHRAREKKLGDIAFLLNIEDTHVVNYSLKKLLAMSLLVTEKRGKEVLYSTSVSGQAICQRYHEIREQLLVTSLASGEPGELSEMARVLRVLSGLYDQAARSATSL